MFYFTQQATFEISRQARNDTNNVIRCIYFVIPSVVEGSPIKLVEKDKNYNLIFISKVKKLFFKYRCDILILFNAKSDNY